MRRLLVCNRLQQELTLPAGKLTYRDRTDAQRAIRAGEGIVNLLMAHVAPCSTRGIGWRDGRRLVVCEGKTRQARRAIAITLGRL